MKRSATTRRASAAAATSSVDARIDSRAEATSSRRCCTSKSSTVSNSARRCTTARWLADASATSAFTRPLSQIGHTRFTPTSQDVCHSLVLGKMRGFGLA